MLFVGNYYDPATNYIEAVSSSKLLPNSRLISSDSWGHTAYGTSQCVTGAVDAYIVRGVLPAHGTRCVGDDQPFTQPHTPGSEEPGEDLRPQLAGSAQVDHLRPTPNTAKQLPPLFIPDRPSVLLGTN